MNTRNDLRSSLRTLLKTLDGQYAILISIFYLAFWLPVYFRLWEAPAWVDGEFEVVGYLMMPLLFLSVHFWHRSGISNEKKLHLPSIVGVSVYRCIGVSVYRCIGVSVYRCIGVCSSCSSRPIWSDLIMSELALISIYSHLLQINFFDIRGVLMKFSFTAAARMRIVIGSLAITLGLMDITHPYASSRWRWVRNWVVEFGGEYGYTVLLIAIGVGFIGWALAESFVNNGDKK